MLISIPAFARRRRCTAVAVRRAIAEGRIPAQRVGKRNFVDPDLADAAWTKNTDPTRLRLSANAARRRARAGNGLAAAAIQLTALRAELLERELREKWDQLISAAHLERALNARLARASELLDDVANRLAPEFAECNEADEIHRILAAEERSVLLALSSSIERGE